MSWDDRISMSSAQLSESLAMPKNDPPQRDDNAQARRAGPALGDALGHGLIVIHCVSLDVDRQCGPTARGARQNRAGSSVGRR